MFYAAAKLTVPGRPQCSLNVVFLGSYQRLVSVSQWEHVPELLSQELCPLQGEGGAGGGGGRATQMCWSIHKIDKSMDRAEKATDDIFSVIQHADLVQLMMFSLCSDNFC